ncbi:8267_t:CDS:2, partial [Dentiscutata erythropus]
LEREDDLTELESVVSSIIETVNNSSFGGIYVDVKTNKLIHGGHISHSGFGTHIICGNIKVLTAFYLNEDESSSESLIITDMKINSEDVGGPVFFYKSDNLHHVDLFDMQVTSSFNLSAALPSNIILEITKLTLHKL